MPNASRRPRGAAAPFDALAALRGKLGSAADKPAAGRSGKRPPQPPAGPRAPAAAAADEAALFRSAAAGASPLRSDGRAEIERPKPAPVPRPRPPEPEVEEPAPARDAAQATEGQALLRAAFEDVIPLKDSGRLDLGPRLRRGHSPLARPEQPATPSADLPLVLPPEADTADPGTLFRQVVRGARPLDTADRVELDRPAPPPAPLKRVADEDAALRESLDTPLTFEDHLEMGDEAAFLRPGLPRRVLSDLRRGRWVLQGELDLHGLTREEARDALAHFLAASLQQGRRCVRVIHGKGLRSPGRFGILKHLSRGWLAQREEILAFCQAGPYAGGSGALLVLLRAGVGASPRP